MDPLIADTLADARWFPLRFDIQSEHYHFAWAPFDVQRAVTFLADLRPGFDERRIVPGAEVEEMIMEQAPLHFILHSGLGGSTLIARALAKERIVTTLKEPPILTDIIALGLKSGRLAADALARQVARLLARPFHPGEAVVVKMSSIGNGLVAPLAEGRASSRFLCLQTPLEAMLASLARRGSEGRLGGRKLFIGLKNSGFADFGFSDQSLAQQSDLRLAALGWVAIQRLMASAAAQFGPERLRSITSEQLFDRPRDSLEAIAEHFAIPLDVDDRLASGVLKRHSKTGEPFDPQARKSALTEALNAYGAEILSAADWARKVADAGGVPLALPYPLLG